MRNIFRTFILVLSVLSVVTLISCGKDKSKDTESHSDSEAEIYYSISGTINGVEVDFSEYDMVMYLALFPDGIFHMTTELSGTAMENFPQEGKYTLADGVITLENGWSGETSDEAIELGIKDEENELTFHCVRWKE